MSAQNLIRLGYEMGDRVTNSMPNPTPSNNPIHDVSPRPPKCMYCKTQYVTKEYVTFCSSHCKYLWEKEIQPKLLKSLRE